MSFSLQGWKSATKEKGFLRSHSYEVTVSPPSGGDGRQIKLRTESVSLPGASFLSADNYRPYGSGKNYDIPYSYNTSEITCVHTLDKNGDIYKIFFEWANLISDIKGNKKFAASYFDEYTTPMTIDVYGNDYTDKVKTIELYNVYPKSVDQLQMSWDTTDDIARLSVSYYYLYYTVS